KKFSQFRNYDSKSEQAKSFILIEDWLNDGVPLSGPVAYETMVEWYGKNQTAKSQWRIDDERIRPEKLNLPTLAVIPSQDRIVPPASAMALAQMIDECDLITPNLGHIGLIVSRDAPEHVWAPMSLWLKQYA